MLKKSLFKPLWPGPSRRVTRLLFQLSTSAIVLTVSKITEGSSRSTDPTLKRHIFNYVLFHLRKTSDTAISKKKKDLKTQILNMMSIHSKSTFKKKEFTEIIYAWSLIEGLFFRLPDFFWIFLRIRMKQKWAAKV